MPAAEETLSKGWTALLYIVECEGKMSREIDLVIQILIPFLFSLVQENGGDPRLSRRMEDI